jgi:AcrR family transcriptional regulator
VTPYHHGSLRPALLAAAVDAIVEHGPGALSMRDLARRAGVSHAALTHHFGDRAGLLTALAGEGYGLLADAMERAASGQGQPLDLAVSYVRFAIDHRGHFELMNRPDLYNPADERIAVAQHRGEAALSSVMRTLTPEQVGEDPVIADMALRSLTHGFATLWLQQSLTSLLGDDPEAATRAVVGFLFRGQPGSPSA